jgi:chromate reductase, NAD(P)H dehydrogenase (quinone)
MLSVRRPRAAEANMQPYTVGYFIGSLSSTSINRRLANALIRLAPEGMSFVEIGFADLPLYRPEFDADYPAPAKAFKAAIADVDALLFVTPEYNRSIPGGLKNAIDFASRPYGQNAFARKPSGVIGTSPGAIGTALAQQHLRTLLAYCNSPQLGAPEAYIQYKEGMIDDDGEVTVESTREFLRKYITEYDAFVRRVLTVLPRGS